MGTITRDMLVKVKDDVYEIGRFRPDMRVSARVFTNEKLLKDIVLDNSLDQLVNMTTLPGIVSHAFAMPDIHEGYGFPIGGVAAFDINNGGIISPGGIGYDINCGVRLLISDLRRADIDPIGRTLAQELSRAVPSGIARGGYLKLSLTDLDKVLSGGAQRMLELGYGEKRDIVFCEEGGMMNGADPSLVSENAKKRGSDQLGTLGSGNHFLEIQIIDTIFDKKIGDAFGLQEGTVAIMIHCGSRGLGHQVCTDYVRTMLPMLPQWKLELPDKELVCAPFTSPIGQQYYAAMQAAANFAWANRHMITHQTRTTWKNIVGDNSLRLLYDVSHNIGKREQHIVNGEDKKLIVHRKGATRSFGPGREELPGLYRHIGQPVLVPGTMGTSSYLLVGTDESMKQAFGSCCHGAGRTMSRMKAKKTIRGSTLRAELEARGIIICSESDPELAEEAPQAYKDVEQVIDVIKNSGLAKPIARLTPYAVIKG